MPYPCCLTATPTAHSQSGSVTGRSLPPFHLVIDLSLSTSSDASIAGPVLYSLNYSLARAHSIRVFGIYAAMAKVTLYTDPYMGSACYVSWYERSHRTGEHADSDAII